MIVRPQNQAVDGSGVAKLAACIDCWVFWKAENLMKCHRFLLVLLLGTQCLHDGAFARQPAPEKASTDRQTESHHDLDETRQQVFQLTLSPEAAQLAEVYEIESFKFQNANWKNSRNVWEHLSREKSHVDTLRSAVHPVKFKVKQ